MNRSKERLLVRFVSGVVAACLTLVASGPSLDAQSFPQYDHVFLLIMENENYNQVIGNRYAPILNALAQDYGLATNYRGVADPSEPNYVAMHNGIVNFANLQTPTELGEMFPFTQLSADLAAATVPNLSYIVPNECNDMHGAPPWCVDSDNTGTVQQSWLIAQGDRFVGSVVSLIISSSMWERGNNAIVITFDEGNTATSQIATIVVTNHGPRGVTDSAS